MGEIARIAVFFGTLTYRFGCKSAGLGVKTLQGSGSRPRPYPPGYEYSGLGFRFNLVRLSLGL